MHCCNILGVIKIYVPPALPKGPSEEKKKDDFHSMGLRQGTKEEAHRVKELMKKLEDYTCKEKLDNKHREERTFFLLSEAP